MYLITMLHIKGTFGEIDHVLLVGVCGGVPHYADFYKHVRLGDILVSSSSLNSDSYYIYCDKTIQDEATDENLNSTKFSIKGWQAKDSTLLDLSRKLKEGSLKIPHGEGDLQVWERYILEGQKALEGQEVAFSRPSVETDRLFMNIGGNDVIEVELVILNYSKFSVVIIYGFKSS